MTMTRSERLFNHLKWQLDWNSNIPSVEDWIKKYPDKFCLTKQDISHGWFQYCPDCKDERQTTCSACGCGYCCYCGYRFSCMPPIDLNQVLALPLRKQFIPHQEEGSGI